MPISHELLMESQTDLFDMGNMSGSDGYDSGGDEPSRRCSTHRRFPEPTCSRGHAGFVRQRTLKLNGMKSQPVFPWLSERSSSGSQANPTTTQEVPQEPKGCAVIAGGSTVTTRRHATASGCCTPVIIFFAISIILVSILVSTVTTLSNATALGRTGPSLWQVDGQFFDAKALDLVSTR